MAAGIFLVRGKFGGGAAAFGIEEEGIVAEAGLAGGTCGQPPFPGALGGQFTAIGRRGDHDADEAAGPFGRGDIGHGGQKFGIVGGIVGMFAGVAGRIDAGRAIQGIDAQAGIVGQTDKPGGPTDGLGLETGVFEKSGAGLGDFANIGELAEAEDLHAKSGKQRMGRPKSAAAEAVVERVRRHFPEAAIRTTFIVGLPGEKKEHFQALLDFVQRARLHHVGVFPYHREEGTPAATMAGQVRRDEKERRAETIMAAQKEISADILDGYVGQELPVLVDAPHPEWPGLHLGRTWFQAPEIDGVTYVSGPGVQPGALVAATIEEAKDYDLVALA